MIHRIIPAISAVLILTAAPAFAADCDSWQDIREQNFAPQPAKIGPSAQPLMLADVPLVEGDNVVMTSWNGDANACIAFVTKEGGTVTGTVPVAALQLIKQPQVDWIGHWEADGEKYLNISDTDDGLNIVGDAMFGANDPASAAAGAVNVGSFDVTLRPKNAVVEFSEDENGAALPYSDDANGCSVRITIVGDFLVANDNNKCGGMNVTFSGFYHRVTKG